MIEPAAIRYQCPGEAYTIDRADHIARLSQFYPKCRQCPHQQDTGPLPARLIAQLAAVRSAAPSAELRLPEGIGGVFLNEFSPPMARRAALAFGRALQNHEKAPSVVLAGDGRDLSPELIAAAAEGLRWAGCDLIDIGVATAACTAFAIEHLQAAGGLLVANPLERPHTVGIKFWGARGQPLSQPGQLEAVFQNWDSIADRPAGRVGGLRRFRADRPYLDRLQPHFHALRPLRLSLQTNCRPWVRHLRQLVADTAVEVIEAAHESAEPPLHLGVSADADGESIRIRDELGRDFPPERLFVLIASHLLADASHAPVIVERETSVATRAALTSLGARVIEVDPRREAMSQALFASTALLGGGPSGRIWLAAEPTPDGLLVLAHLLTILSRSDQPLSEVCSVG